MNRQQISSIADQFVDAVKSALESAPDWSTDPVILYRRTVENEIETAEFADSAYITRAAYNLRANDLRITLRNGKILRIVPISVDYWDRLLAAPSKGRFFLDYIEPRHNVEWMNVGRFRRILRSIQIAITNSVATAARRQTSSSPAGGSQD
jgi:KTSC domain